MTLAAKTRLLGMTTSIPIEVAMAAGYTPVDLNNRFITSAEPQTLVRRGEEMGLPRTLCAWIKGIYVWALDHPEVDSIVAVTQGDCSNTHGLMELLQEAGRTVIAFDYPLGRRPQDLKAAIEGLAERLGADLDRAEEVRRSLLGLRRDLERLDRMTWQEGRVSGLENHLWLVGASDFEGDAAGYHQRLRDFLDQAEQRPQSRPRLRLGLLGVPPIIQDLHETLEQMGAAVVYNEVPRQFAMLPKGDGPGDLVEQYQCYTYPYDVFWRMEDIAHQARRRSLHGLIHYTQAFCFRQMQDLVMRRRLDLPMLTIEGDQVAAVDGRTRTRLEAFGELLAQRSPLARPAPPGRID